jgi:arylsulfatase A-like enzyme
MTRFITVLSVLLVAVIAFIIFSSVKTSKVASCPDCNVILISIDTLRYDHLSCYGYKHKTPAIDAFSKESVKFNTNISQAPSTAPSHASMLTGLIPASHGAFIKRETPIKAEVKTLAEILLSSGFRTVSFNGGGQLDKKLGFSRGFEVYDSYSEANYENEKFSDRVSKGIDWIGKNNKNKFFLFLHSYDIHVPYAPEKADLDAIFPDYKGSLTVPITDKFLKKVNAGKLKLSNEDKNFIVAAYDAEIKSVDRAFSTLIEYLKSSNLYDKTIIIFTSDHGEEFGEHGFMGWHSHTLFDELLRVPLLIKLPEQSFSDKEISTQTRTIDILPTLLDILNIKADPILQGKSLTGLIENSNAEFDPYAISQKDRSNSLPTSARTSDWKMYKQSLYDLKADPKEMKDVAEKNPEVKKELRAVIDDAKKLDDSSKNEKIEIEDDSVEQLKTLGYL